MNHPVMFIARDNKTKLVPRYFSYFVELCERKKKFNLQTVIVLNKHFNVSIIKKLIKQFHLHCPCKKVIEKSNQ